MPDAAPEPTKAEVKAAAAEAKAEAKADAAEAKSEAKAAAEHESEAKATALAGLFGGLAKPAEPAKPPKHELTVKEKGAAVSAVAELRAHLDGDPEHPATGVAGILPAWMALILKQFGPEIVALLEKLLGITPPPAAPAKV